MTELAYIHYDDILYIYFIYIFITLFFYLSRSYFRAEHPVKCAGSTKENSMALNLHHNFTDTDIFYFLSWLKQPPSSSCLFPVLCNPSLASTPVCRVT